MSDAFTLSPIPRLVVVRAGGAIIGESRNALSLKEGRLPERIYIPREDIGMAFLEPSETRTRCPHKGEAQYYSIVAKSGPIPDAGWSYEDPVPAAEAIRGHLAFSHEKVTVEAL
ncbi:MAG: DUF427 domain-containing protein [Pseudomonadota bacterium]